MLSVKSFMFRQQGAILRELKTTKNCNLTFRWPCVVIYSYNKTNEMHYFLKFMLGIELYMFWTVPLSIIRSFSLYKQQ